MRIYLSIFYLQYHNLWLCISTQPYPTFLQQKRTVRTIKNAGYTDHTDPIFKELKLLKINDIYNFQLGCHMYHARARGEYATQTNYQTRDSNRALPVRHRTTTTQHAVSYKGPTFWSSLPPDIRSINNFKRFRKSLKEHLLGKY